MSTFSGLNAATTALWANRRALDVTGQNIANVNTEGYSRQRVDLSAIGGSAVPAFFSTTTGIGQGVSADDVLRIRDIFLEGRGHTEHANLTQLTAESDSFELVEQAFREPGSTGIQKMLSEVWSGWQDVANNPADPAARGQVLKRLETLAGGLHFSQEQLGGQWDPDPGEPRGPGRRRQRRRREHRPAQRGDPARDAGQPAGQRPGRPARRPGHEAGRPDGRLGAHGKDGLLDVIVGGITLVSGGSASKLALSGTMDPDDVGGDPVKVVTAVGNLNVSVGGTAGGQLTAMNTIIPGYRTQLDGIASNLATVLNDAHADGFDRTGTAGGPVFGSSDGGPITAANIKVLITRHRPHRRLGRAGCGEPGPHERRPDRPAGADGRHRRGLPEDDRRPGRPVGGVQRNFTIQSSITTTVDAARESVAGVNLDEELTNMLSYQHAYAAAGRMITAIDEALDVLINRTGVVGR